MKTAFHIAVLPGDGIGVEVTSEALQILRSLKGGFHFEFTQHESGADCYLRKGTDLPEETVQACRDADAILLGAMGHPDIRKPDGTELAPQVALREILDLYAGVRPCKLYAGARCPLTNMKPGDIDLVVLREQSEGLFASRQGGIVLNDQVATDTQIITRAGAQRICQFAFRLARERIKHLPDRPALVTCVDKANIFKSFAFFRKVFDEVGRAYPDIEQERTYIDAQALFLVQRPRRYNVLVAENMFGDILSDLAAGLVGGMGMAPSADMGERHGLFQPAHGTAPDIAGKDIANPVAAILSAGMMLDWLGKRHGNEDLIGAGRRIEEAVAQVLREGNVLPRDQGGKARTGEFGDAVRIAISR